MCKFGMAILFAVFSTSCVHEVEAPRASVKGHRSVPAVSAVMARQTQNATDLGDGDLVAKSLREKLAKNPNDLDARLRLAGHYQQQGSPELALDHYAMAAQRFPDNAQIRLLAAKTMRNMDAGGEAAELLLTYWRSHRVNTPANLLSELGILDDDLGKFADAEYAYRAALTIDPRAAAIHNNLGYNLLLQEKTQQAAAEFRVALKIEPHSQIARDNLGIALASLAKNSGKSGSQPADRKRAEDEALLNFQSVSGPATAHNNLAAILIEQGRYPEARRELNLALSYRKDFPPALDNLRLVSELDGKPATISVVPAHGIPMKRAALSALVGTGPEDPPAAKAKDDAAQAITKTPEE